MPTLIGHHQGSPTAVRPAHLTTEFPYLPRQSRYNKHLRTANTLISTFIRTLARNTDLWHNDLRIVDSTPVERARSRPTAKRSDLAGRAGYGYCPSHSQYFWDPRLHLMRTPGGPPIARAPANPRTDEREVPAGILTPDRDLPDRQSPVTKATTPNTSTRS
ncbi:hypothetical protein ABZ922_31265 [Streptomyces shenzhenensis]